MFRIQIKFVVWNCFHPKDDDSPNCLNASNCLNQVLFFRLGTEETPFLPLYMTSPTHVLLFLKSWWWLTTTSGGRHQAGSGTSEFSSHILFLLSPLKVVISVFPFYRPRVLALIMTLSLLRPLLFPPEKCFICLQMIHLLSEHQRLILLLFVVHPICEIGILC